MKTEELKNLTTDGENKKQSIHTLKSDADKYIKEKNVSIADIALAEKKKKRIKEKTNSGKKFFAPVLLVAFIATAAFGIYFAYGKFFKKPTEEKKAGPPASYIFSDKIVPVSLNGVILDEEIKQLLEKKYSEGEFIYFPFTSTNGILNTKELFETMSFRAPKELADFLNPNFNFLIHSGGNSNNKNSFIFAFKTENFRMSYAAMLYWENVLLKDFKNFLNEQENKKSSETLNSTNSSKPASTSKETLPKQGKFYSKLINNNEIRVINSEHGAPVLMYGFFAQKYLIITNSEETFKQSAERLKIYSL